MKSSFSRCLAYQLLDHIIECLFNKIKLHDPVRSFSAIFLPQVQFMLATVSAAKLRIKQSSSNFFLP